MELTREEISFLAGNFYKNTNPLSLFSSINGIPVRGDEQKSLENSKVLTGGKPTSEADRLLSVVANPEKCTRIVLKDGDYVVEKYTYKSDKGFTIAENNRGQVIFSSHDKLNETLFQLSQWVGMSDLKTFDIKTTLSNDEVVVFFAIADIARADALLNYLGQETKGQISFTQIREQIDNPKSGSLVKILTRNYKYNIPKTEDTKVILEKLISKKIITLKEGYLLLDEYENFAKKFLIPQNVVILETFNLGEKNKIAGAGVLCISAGMRENLAIIFREGATEIASISGRQLLKMIEDFMDCPDVV